MELLVSILSITEINIFIIRHFSHFAPYWMDSFKFDENVMLRFLSKDFDCWYFINILVRCVIIKRNKMISKSQFALKKIKEFSLLY